MNDRDGTQRMNNASVRDGVQTVTKIKQQTSGSKQKNISSEKAVAYVHASFHLNYKIITDDESCQYYLQQCNIWKQ